jgi:hypothetical protein
MFLPKLIKTSKLATIILASFLAFSPSVLAVDIDEDKLNPDRGLKWGGDGLPVDDVVVIRDSLVNSVIGKVAIDRHGEDNVEFNFNGNNLFRSLVKTPFAGPLPGRKTIVTLWGSKEEGCFVKTLVHDAPKGNSSAEGAVPVKLEIGLGDRIVKLSPIAKNSAAKTTSSNYEYKEDDISKTATMHYGENTFAVNAKVADLFRNAPKGNAKVRVTFSNGASTVFPVGEKNVARWRDTFGYNPNCAKQQ